MLPSMTTSKSFRASMLPASLSFPSFRSTSNTDCNANSNSNSHPSPDPEKSKRRSLWHKGTTHLPMRRPLPARDLKEESKSATATTPAPAATNLTKEQREQQGQQEQRDPSPAQPLPSPHFQKSPSWGLRLSSLVPLLTPDTADTHPVSVNRKPVAVNMIPPPQTPPPPPYVASEAEDERSGSRSRTTTSVEASGSAEAAVDPQESPRAQIRAQIRTVPPIPESEPPEVPEFAISFSTHQTPEILAPIPPSPDSRHAALTKQEPAIQLDTWRVSGAADNENESQKQAKLQKDNYKPRPRRNSLFQPKLPESQPGNVYPRQMSPNPESRGRRSVSGQMSLAPSGSVSLAPNSRSASSHDGSQSPTRAKLRRSWLPGGARSRSNSEVTSGVKPEAWILSDDTHAEYNPSFLKNGEKVTRKHFSNPPLAHF